MTGELSHTEKEDHCGHALSAFAQEDVKSRRTKDGVIVFGGTIFDRRLNSSLQLVGDLVVDSSSLGRERYSFNDEIDRRQFDERMSSGIRHVLRSSERRR